MDMLYNQPEGNIKYDLKHFWGYNSIESNMEQISLKRQFHPYLVGNKHITKNQITSI